MINNKNKSKGFVAIVSLLIISTISMIFAMLMLRRGLDNASLSLSSIYYENSRVNVNVCLEDTLLRLRQEEHFDRNLNYTITDEDSCSTIIIWYTPQQIAPGVVETLVDLEVTGVSGDFSRTFTYGLKITRHDVNHSDGSLDYMNTIDIISIEEQTA
jgi:hypothetical protein